MRTILLLLAFAACSWAQCGKLVVNPTTGRLDCIGTGGGGGGGGTVVAAYVTTVTVTAGGSATISAATHGQSTHPVVNVTDNTGTPVAVLYTCSGGTYGCSDASSTGNVTIGPFTNAGTYGVEILGGGGGGAIGIPITSTDIATPANPAAGTTSFYPKGGTWCSLSPAGVENCTGGGGATFPASATSVYLLNEGTGTVVTDSAGSNNGTLCTSAATPTWQGGGLRMNGGQCFTIPAAAVSGAAAIGMWVNIDGTWSGQTTNTRDYLWSIGENTETGFNWNYAPLIADVSSAVANVENFNFWLVNPINKLAGPSSFTLVRASPSIMYVNGLLPTAYIQTPVNLPVFSTSIAFNVGSLGNVGTQGMRGTVYGFVVYHSVPSAADVAQSEAAMRFAKSKAGVQFVGNSQLDNHWLIVGDSISANNGNSLYAKISGYPQVASQLLQQSNYTILSVPGARSSNLLPSIPAELSLMANSDRSPNVLLPQWGTNDLSNSVTAATLYSNTKSACTSAHAVGALCIVPTVMPAGSITGAKETARTTYNASVITGFGSGDLKADGIADWAADPIMGNALSLTQTTYYASDQIHPAIAGNVLDGHSVAFAYVTATKSAQPIWLKKTIPYFVLTGTASTTATLPLWSFVAGQKVCGVTAKVTTAFVGTSISALTVSVGDSGGSATSYTSALNLLATGTQDTLPTFVSSAGVVQAVLTATGANLSGMTQGSVDVDVCIVYQP